MGFANGGDLFEMVAGVNELETTPLVYAERAKDVVGGEPALAEELLAFVAEKVEAG